MSFKTYYFIKNVEGTFFRKAYEHKKTATRVVEYEEDAFEVVSESCEEITRNRVIAGNRVYAIDSTTEDRYLVEQAMGKITNEEREALGRYLGVKLEFEGEGNGSE